MVHPDRQARKVGRSGAAYIHLLLNVQHRTESDHDETVRSVNNWVIAFAKTGQSYGSYLGRGLALLFCTAKENSAELDRGARVNVRSTE